MECKAFFIIFAFCACVVCCGACSCLADYSLRRFCGYNVVVRGRAVSVEIERQGPPDDPFSLLISTRVYTVSVDQAIAMPGSLQGQKILKLRTPFSGSVCGTTFPLFQERVFFANEFEGRLNTGLCDPNGPWNSLSRLDKDVITHHISDHC